MSTKLITVFGSTGLQGGSVVRQLLKNGEFKVRAFTRNPESDNAKELTRLGAEVVKCDESESSENLENAMSGSYGVFLVTNFWGYFEKELEYGIKISNAALKIGVKHFVFSSLSAANKISNGKYSVPDLDLKSEIENHIVQLSKDNSNFVSSFVYAPFYMQNFKNFPPTPSEDGKTYTIDMPIDPQSKYPLELGDITEIGYVVNEIFKSDNQQQQQQQVNYKHVPFSGDSLTGEQIAQVFSKVSGKQVEFNFIPPQVFATFDFIPGSNEIATMFSYFNEFGYFHQSIDKSIASSFHKFSTLEEYLISTNFKFL